MVHTSNIHRSEGGPLLGFIAVCLDFLGGASIMPRSTNQEPLGASPHHGLFPELVTLVREFSLLIGLLPISLFHLPFLFLTGRLAWVPLLLFVDSAKSLSHSYIQAMENPPVLPLFALHLLIMMIWRNVLLLSSKHFLLDSLMLSRITQHAAISGQLI